MAMDRPSTQEAYIELVNQALIDAKVPPVSPLSHLINQTHRGWKLSNIDQYQTD